MGPHSGAVTSVLVVDDHRTFAELLAGALDREPDLVSVGHATTAAEALTMNRALRPDLVVMDVQLPDADGFVATRMITADAPSTRVIMLSAQGGQENTVAARRAGACGYVVKDGSLDHLLVTLRTATLGQFLCDPAIGDVDPPPSRPRAQPDVVSPTLTPRESDVLALLGQGQEVRDIADRLGVTPATCRGYVKSLLVKLDAHSQLQAVVAAWRLGLLPRDLP
jgi:DNA-binding NarL/FixJ family response regulator